MDKNEKLQEQITELQDKMSRVEAVLGKITLQKLDEAIKKYEATFEKPEPAKVRPRAERGARFYFRDSSDGEIQWYFDTHNDFCNFLYNTGNYFLDKEDCEKYCEAENAKALARQRIRDYILSHGLSFEPNWKDKGQKKHTLHYEPHNEAWSEDYIWNWQELGVEFYFASEKHALQVIRDCEDDLNILR